jgi:hypothetical protein
MTTTALSHSPAPTVPPISTVCTGRFSVDFGTLYKLVTIVSGVAIAVFAILEVQYLVAACALTLSAFAINSCFNREPIPQNPPQLSAISSTQTPPSLGNPLDRSAASTVASSESNDDEYNSFDEENEFQARSAERARPEANPWIGAHRTDRQSVSDLYLARQATYIESPYQPAMTRYISQTPSEEESSSEEGMETSGSENDHVKVYPLDFGNASSSDDDRDPPDIAASRKLATKRVTALLDEDN